MNLGGRIHEMIDAATAAVATVVVVQGGAMLFWGGKTSSRVAELEKKVEPIVTLQTDMATLNERMKHLIGLLERGTGRGRRAAPQAAE